MGTATPAHCPTDIVEEGPDLGGALGGLAGALEGLEGAGAPSGITAFPIACKLEDFEFAEGWAFFHMLGPSAYGPLASANGSAKSEFGTRAEGVLRLRVSLTAVLAVSRSCGLLDEYPCCSSNTTLRASVSAGGADLKNCFVELLIKGAKERLARVPFAAIGKGRII